MDCSIFLRSRPRGCTKNTFNLRKFSEKRMTLTLWSLTKEEFSTRKSWLQIATIMTLGLIFVNLKYSLKYLSRLGLPSKTRCLMFPNNLTKFIGKDICICGILMPSMRKSMPKTSKTAFKSLKKHSKRSRTRTSHSLNYGSIMQSFICAK
jgi:hypothetical protein